MAKHSRRKVHLLPIDKIGFSGDMAFLFFFFYNQLLVSYNLGGIFLYVHSLSSILVSYFPGYSVPSQCWKPVLLEFRTNKNMVWSWI